MSSKYNRVVQMDMLIRNERYPAVATFRQRFEVSARTVHDDLAFLRDSLGAPLAYSRARGGYYYTDQTWTLPAMMVSEGELLAFFLSVELARRYLGTTFEQPLRSAVEKLARQLPAEQRVDLGELAGHYSFSSGATAPTDPQLLLALDRAIRERRPVAVRYYTPGRNAVTDRTWHPYHLRNVRGDWQVVAYDSYRARVRTFAVDRVREWSVQHHERFTWEEGFSLDAYLASQFISERIDEPIAFAIWFDPYQARYIRERHWHVTQQPLEEHPDGSVTLRFTGGSLNEVQRWVLGFGAHARILEPASLAAETAAELRAALELYERA